MGGGGAPEATAMMGRQRCRTALAIGPGFECYLGSQLSILELSAILLISRGELSVFCEFCAFSLRPQRGFELCKWSPLETPRFVPSASGREFTGRNVVMAG